MATDLPATSGLGYYYFWREIGTRMGIVDIPASYRSVRGLEPRLRAPSSGSRIPTIELRVATRDLFASWFPRIATPLVRYGIYAMLDDADDRVVRVPEAAAADTAPAALDAGAARPDAVRWLPPRRAAHFFTDNPNRTHASGDEIAEVGTSQRLVAREREHSHDAE